MIVALVLLYNTYNKDNTFWSVLEWKKLVLSVPVTLLIQF